MNENISGAFVFRNEGSGCLTSLYIEHKTRIPYPECCKREGTPPSNDPFEGSFNTCWFEPGDQHTASLSIQRSGDVYDLHWTHISQSDWQYDGVAMLFEGKLVGSYWKR